MGTVENNRQLIGKEPKDRKERLAEQLRANLQRRKQQARSRRTGAPDERPEGIAAAEASQKK